MQRAWHYLQEKWISWLIRLLLIGLLMLLVYYGSKLWMQYAHSEAFKGEVNAAIITGVVGIVTLIGTTIFNGILSGRSQHITIRDEILKRRIEVYHQLLDNSRKVHQAFDKFLVKDPSVTNKQAVQDALLEFDNVFQFNRFCLSKRVEAEIRSYRSFCQSFLKMLDYYTVKDFDLHLQRMNFHSDKVILTSTLSQTIFDYHQNLFLIVQAELGLKSIDKAIDRLRDS
ncbi:hypothetical protein [Thermoflavimicrobium daqui]|jgi:hypothetical protein|uniref:Uncharacterized protein n=1 Tax=Thermoflavimicrobium daqui TaxID=2137476 RepID=A0A364K175_9BACL|nr:hypothetical protein [Thermoflavimicrobium daqui]RAL21450.1 hypothetical protein DL897_15960 [Thermoflavimicrobium daqui]